mgnify:CR=1 FL=1
MMISEHSITEFEQREHHSCSQQEFPVSPLVAPGSSEARQMTAGSGRRLYESYGKHRPLGAFLRILLESETWSSTEFLLTWKLKATKSKCLVFQLAPSMPRTGANATGLSEGTWRTPRATDQARPASTRCRNFTEGIKSEFQLREQVKATWPTPDAMTSGNVSSGCLAQTEKFVARLTTLSAWLMGYTAAYLAHWETASCRKSRRKS